jgi:hypothetical protein
MAMSSTKLPVKLFDLAILILMVHKGSQEERVGFEDCSETLESLTRKLDVLVNVEQSSLESALWSANIMNDIGKFWHPEGLSFDEFTKSVAGKHKFDKRFSTIERKDK